MVANAALIVTGGLVRLTKSGLGCPTWPKCKESYLPDPSLGGHGIIEFGNRTLTFVLVALALITYLRARQTRGPLRPLVSRISFGIGLGIIAQALIGGLSVLTRLNPWVVSLHLVASLVLVALCVWLVRICGGERDIDVPPLGRRVALATVAVGFVAMWLGTVVTGAGPNSGDDGARRSGLDLYLAARVHAVSVWVMVALTAASAWLLRRTRARAAAVGLLVAELVQGAIGYWQYFTGLPWWLVILHMLGVALVTIALCHLLFAVVRAHRPLSETALD